MNTQIADAAMEEFAHLLHQMGLHDIEQRHKIANQKGEPTRAELRERAAEICLDLHKRINDLRCLMDNHYVQAFIPSTGLAEQFTEHELEHYADKFYRMYRVFKEVY